MRLRCTAKLMLKEKLFYLLCKIELSHKADSSVFHISTNVSSSTFSIRLLATNENGVQRKLKRSSVQVCAVSFYILNIISCSAYLRIPIPFIGWLVLWLGSFQGRHFFGV